MSGRLSSAADVLRGLDAGAVPDAEAIADALPVSGASVSTMGDFLGTETLAASDDRAARLDELQFDLGIGPCWDALATALPVLEPDLLGDGATRWPALSQSLHDSGVAAVFAFPLMLGPLKLGAVDLYSDRTQPLGRVAEEQAVLVAAVLSRHILRRALRSVGRDEHPQEGTKFSRRVIHQATGFVIAQLGISAEDAHLLIQGQAFADGRSMRDVAEDIVERRLSFAVDASGIEEIK